MAGAEAEVLAAFEALEEALGRRDLGALLACCTEDVRFIGSGDGEEAVGRAGVEAMFEALAAIAEDTAFRIEWEPLGVDVRGDVALITAFGTATLTDPETTTTMRYRLTGVLLLVDGHWLWHVHHGSEPAAW